MSKEGLSVFSREIVFGALGTDISIQINFSRKTDETRAHGDLERLEKSYSKKEKIFSRFDAKSELSRLNGDIGNWQGASADMLQAAKLAIYWYDLSGGIFDPRIIEILETIGYGVDFKKMPAKRRIFLEKISKIENNLREDLKMITGRIFFGKRMDFSGLAKGYITDWAVKFLRERGWENFLVDSGGDMYAAGDNVNSSGWLIFIEGFPEEKMRFKLKDLAVATSGITRRKWESENGRFHHLINPRNPERFSFDLKSVSVVAKTAEEADVWAKILFILGKEKGLALARKKNLAAIFLDYRGNAFVAEDANKYFA